MNKFIIACVLFLLLVLAPSIARADVYLRGSLGIGALALTDEYITVSGGAVDLSLSVGVTVSHKKEATKTVLYGELVGVAAVSPNVAYEGSSFVCLDCTVGVGSHLLPGVGVAQYTASGWNLHGSLHLLKASLDIQGAKFESDRGAVFFLTGGKDFKVSEDASMGVALRAGAGTIEGETVSTFALQMVISRY